MSDIDVFVIALGLLTGTGLGILVLFYLDKHSRFHSKKV